MSQTKTTYVLIYSKNGIHNKRNFNNQHAAWAGYDKAVSNGASAKLVQVQEFVIAEHEPEGETDE